MIPRNPLPVRAPRLARRRRLLLVGCAAGAAALTVLQPQPARAQAFLGEISGTSGTVARNPTGPGTETITIGSPTAIIDWAPSYDGQTDSFEFLPQGHVATFEGGQGFAVLNRIGGPARIEFNGTVIGQLQGAPGTRTGTILFQTPGGFLVGPTAVFNVGSLVLTSLSVATTGAGGPGPYFDPASLGFAIGGHSPTASIVTEAGSQINAPAEGSYVAMVAPRVEHAGTVTVNGSAAFVAAEAVDITINQGLFDINVTSGSSDGQGVVHTGTTTGPASSGGGDNHGIYMVAVPKNQAVVALLQGSAGYAPAGGATIENGRVVLTAGYNVAAGAPSSRAGGTGDASFTIQNGTYSSDVLGRASFEFAINDAVGPVTFQQDLSVQGDDLAQMIALTGFQIRVFGDLALTSRDDRTGLSDGSAAIGGQVALSAESGSSILIGGDALLEALAIGAGGFGVTPGGNAEGGAASARADDGTIVIGGRLRIDSTGTGGAGTIAGNGLAGDASILALNGGEVDVGTLIAYAQGIGGSGPGSDGGDGEGGEITILASGAGSRITVNVPDADSTLSVSGFGGANQGGGNGVAGSGTGGDLLVSATNGGEIDLSSLFGIAWSRGFGGAPAADGAIGGFGQGGTVTFEAVGAGSSLTTGRTNISSNGFGILQQGPLVGANVTGGDAAGGTTILRANDGGELVLTNAAFARAAAIAGDGTGTGNGGTGTGGALTIEVDGGALRIEVLSLEEINFGASGFGGAGAIGGDGIAGVISVRVANGGLLQANNPNVQPIDISLRLFAEGQGGIGDVRGGIGQGGTIDFVADPLSTGSIVDLGSLAVLSVNGSGGDVRDGSAGVGGAGIGGQINVVTGVAGDTWFFAALGIEATGTGGESLVSTPGASGGSGTGGSARVESQAGQLATSAALRLDASGTGGNGFGTGAGGVGTGGFAQLLANGGTIDLAGQTSILASGLGGSGRNGADGFGGQAGILALSGTVTFDEAGVSAEGIGGSASSGLGGTGGRGQGRFAYITADFDGGTGGVITGGSATVLTQGLGGRGGSGDGAGIAPGAGGVGQGGTFDGIPASGGAFVTAQRDRGQLTVGDTVLVSSGLGGVGGEGGAGQAGGAGGAGLGGTAQTGLVTLLGDGSIGLGSARYGNIDLNAGGFGLGGVGPAGTGAGGTGTGGNVFLISRSGEVEVAAASLAASGIGGAGGTGGTGIGGEALALSEAGGTLDIAGAADLFARGRGGAGSGVGGGATGGRAQVNADGGDQSIDGNLEVNADGIGGTGGTGVGGNGVGGLAELLVNNGADLEIVTALVTASGSGGAGASGGTGNGGFNTAPDGELPNAGASIFARNGGRLTGASLTVAATGTGGAGSSGAGGAGNGGGARTTARNGTAPTLIDLDSLTLNADATGGAGGTGAAGGAATGGALSAVAETLNGNLAVDDLLASADALGGAGGAGADGGAGGSGGGATGGSATGIGTASGIGAGTPAGGTTFGTVTVSVSAVGGAGGAGGAGATPGAGGDGGNAVGGASTNLLARGGTLTVTDAALSANATGGAGGAAGGGGAAAGRGGNATGGSANAVLTVRNQTTDPATVTVGTLQASSIAQGGIGSSNGETFHGAAGIEIDRSSATFGSVELTVTGAAPAPSVQPTTIRVDGGTLAVTGAAGLDIDTPGDVLFDLVGSGVVNAQNLASAAGGTTTIQHAGRTGTADSIAGATLSFTAGGDLAAAAGTQLRAQTSLSLATDANTALAGNLFAPALAIRSADIDVGAAALVGDPDNPGAVTLTVAPSGQQTVVGGTTEGPGYTLTQAESERIEAQSVTLAVSKISAAPDRAPDLVVGNLLINGSGNGGVSSVTVQTDGIARVAGAVEYRGAAAADRLTIEATDRLEVITPDGRITLVNAASAPSGQLTLRSNSIIVASAGLAAQLAADPALSGRAGQLRTNSGPVNEAGYLQAGTIGFVSGGTVFVQNSGTDTALAGLTVGGGAGALSFDRAAPTTPPLDVIAFGRRQNADGSFTTGEPFFATVDFRTAQGVTYTNGAQVNGCFVNGGCPLPPPPPPPPPPPDPDPPDPTVPPSSDTNASVVAGPLDQGDTLAAADEPAPEPVQNVNATFVGIVDTTNLSAEELIDEPVTSGGDSTVWEEECDPEDPRCETRDDRPVP